jgi:hypothetical protein
MEEMFENCPSLNEEFPSQPDQQHGQEVSKRLTCLRCARIDFSKMDHRERKATKYSFRLGSSSDMTMDPSCPSCKIFSLLLCRFSQSSNGIEHFESTFHLFPFRTSTLYINEYRAKIPPTDDTVSFLITDTAYQFQYQVQSDGLRRANALGYVGPAIRGSSDTRFSVRPINPLVDIRIMKSWLKYCCSNHGNTCSPTAKLPLRHIRVIDC